MNFCTFAQMFRFAHLEGAFVPYAVLAVVKNHQMKSAVLRLKRHSTQTAVADHIKCILMKLVVTGVGIMALLHVLPV